MKKPVQSDAKGEKDSREQLEPQEQVGQSISQAVGQSETPEVSSPSLVSDVSSEASHGVQDTEVPHEERNVEEAPSSQSSPPLQTSRVRKRKRKIETVSEEEIMPRPSYWPLALALSLVILLFGTIAQPIIAVVGLILFIGSIIGWFVERR
jgi:hypothetical protein